MKVLVVDDTITYRKIIADIARPFDDVDSVATAASGSIALRKMAADPVDLVFLDIEMPDMDGLETLARIREEFPTVQVAMVSGVTERGASTTMKALEMGAIEFIRKPTEGTQEENTEALARGIRSVVRVVQTRRLTSSATPSDQAQLEIAAPRRVAPVPKRFGVLAIGVSTGGPKALTQVIPSLPATFPVPVVVVQHMPPMFTEALARDLDKRSALRVVEAAEGAPVTRGTVHIAPGGRHMTVRGGEGGWRVALNDGPPENSCRPAVDVLFRSMATTCADAGVLAVVMTGMGSDGKRGVEALKRKGCYCLTQSENSCVVYGMPMAVDRAGLSDESVDLGRLAARIIDLATKGKGWNRP